MNINKIEKLLAKLDNLLAKYGDETIKYECEILKKTLTLIKSDCNYEDKIQQIKHNYKMMFPIRGGLTEFNVWDDDYEKRININEPIDEVRDKLWEIFREF